MTASGSRAGRRSTSEVRSLVLAAAGDQFTRLGYDATTTKAVAVQAGVSERLIYSNFGTKDDLFREAVVSPFDELIGEYIEAWLNSPDDAPVEQLMTMFVRGFYELARRNRAVLLSCVSHDRGGGDRPHGLIVRRLAGAVQSMRASAHGMRDTHGLRNYEAGALIVASAGMVLGAALLDDLIFEDDSQRPPADQLIAEMVALVCHGIVSS